MPNRKITQLNPNTNPTISDVFPIVNNGVTKKLSLDGLVSFLTPYLSDSQITGGTYNSVDGTLSLINSTGGTINVTGFSTSTGTSFTGGTVSGATQFTNGLTANTISATTYQNLPSFTGGTVSGATRFTNGLTANTISATTYQNLPLDIKVTGGTYSSSAETATFTNNTGGTFSVTGIPNGNTKKWKTGGIVEISGEETILVSGNYVLQDSELNILDGGNTISIGNILFEEKGELYIGGNTFFNDTTINNDGIISIAGALILSGNTTITGTGIII